MIIPWDISGLGAGALGLRMAALVDGILAFCGYRIQKEIKDIPAVDYSIL